MPIPTEAFAGTERYEIRGMLGAGGMGIVYAAWDRERGCEVALKTLHRLEPMAMWRFKREFRAIADLSHSNLVRLYDLVADGDRWFFTMERVYGGDLHTWIGLRTWPGADTETGAAELSAAIPQEGRPPSADDEEGTRPWLAGDTEAGPPPPTTAPRLRAVGGEARALRLGGDEVILGRDLARVRWALRGLAQGIQALHEVGSLHRDIKPSNVLVGPDGRVVLLDLGLVQGILPSEQSADRHIAGTAAYMSPEQAVAAALTPASDWYSLGVVLFEALTGIRPFRGTFDEVLVAKQRAEPRRPSSLRPDIPSDLDELCARLLRFDPAARPTGDEVLRTLGPAGGLAVESTQVRPLSGLIGREREVAWVQEAFHRRGNGPVVVHLSGSSGIGKSALLRAVLDDLANREGATVLLGRCYERESVPFKAVDALVDALARHLRGLSRAVQEAVLPRDVAAVARLFPVLRQVEVVAVAPTRTLDQVDPQELRRRAFAAFRELIGRLADRQPLVLAIDDLQWGDLDGVQLLHELGSGVTPPSILLLLAYRREDVGWGHLAAIRALTGLPPTPGELPHWVTGPFGPGLDLPLPPLSDEGSRSLAAMLLPERAGAWGRIDELVQESRGSPFLLGELCRHTLEQPPEGADWSLRLEDVIRRRLAALAPSARLLLETVAVAGHPVARPVARRAADLGADDQDVLAALRAAHLIRTRGGGDDTAVEPYHDRIREAIVEQLSAGTVRERHLRLALALEGSRQADPELLCEHFCGAGHLERAGEYALLAAEQARRSLAFERAVVLFRLAERLLPPGGDARPIRRCLAQALVEAGRSKEAADLFAALVVEGAPEPVELQRQAAEQYLRSGHLDEGFAALRAVLDAAGVGMPTTPRGALLSLLAHRIRARIRGLGWKERPADEIPAAVRAKIDLCWSVGEGLAMIDPIRGGDFQTRHLLLALDAGEPHRVARALVMEAGYRCTVGQGGRRQAARLLDEAEALAIRLENPHAQASARSARGILAYEGGFWLEARSALETAELEFQQRCTGVAWELSTTRHFLVLSLLQLGDLRELVGRVPTLIREAEEKGDRFTASAFRNGCMNLCWLVQDDPATAARCVEDALQPWRWPGYLLQHYEGLYARATIALYLGDGPAAWAHFEEAWPQLEAAQLLSIEQLRLEILWLRGRSALQALRQKGPPSLQSVVRSAISGLKRPGVAWALPLATLLEGGLLAWRGDTEGARAAFVTTLPAWDRLSMALHGAVTRRRIGTLVSGVEGSDLVRDADRWLSGQGVVRPAAMMDLFVP